MKVTVSMQLSDDVLRRYLEHGDVVIFTGDTLDWQDIERQVERLGFGETHIVSAAQRADPADCRISIKPASERVLTGNLRQ